VSDQRIAAEDLSAAVRVHADRVHDFLRRLGCTPTAAIEVVETSALDLIETAAGSPRQVTDVVGWWFGRARALGTRVAGGATDLPLGGGLLAADADQAKVAEALERLPERERVAVLLRDSYALSAAAVAVALGTDADAAMETAGRGRLRFLQAVGDELPSTGGHPVQLAALARLGMGGPVAARDATPRRHAQSCAICGAVLAAQERAHRLLSGLTVVALPDADRDALLARVDAQARTALPAAGTLPLEEELDEDLLDERPSRLLLPLYALVGVVVAVVLGAVIGVLASRDNRAGTSTSAPPDEGAIPAVTAAPVLSPSPVPSVVLSPSAQPSPSVFTISPTPSAPPAQPSGAAASPEPATEPLTLTGDPTSGPNGQTVNLQGTGWLPAATMRCDYLDPLGRSTGSRAEQVVDARGRFTTTISAEDPANLPGRHTIRCTDGTSTATTPYQVTG
jgi:DNA-directed RNA polymerase specialized sigma24 family protein